MVELKKGNTDKACEYLLEAGKTPGSPQLNSFGPDMMLANELLKRDKKECVIKFLKSCSKFWKRSKVCNEWIKQVEAGDTSELNKIKTQDLIWKKQKLNKQK